jgi:hypothetical protein
MEPVMNAVNSTTSTDETPQQPPSKKKKAFGKTNKLKSTKWYQSAAQSIGMTKKESSPKSR